MSNRPKTAAELSVGEKMRGVLHRLTSGAARKPEAIVRLPVPVEDLRADHPAIFESSSAPSSSNKPTILKMSRLAINATASKWVEVVYEICQQARVKSEDLWVLIHCSGVGRPVFFSTRVRDDILAFSNQPTGEGRIHVFVRMVDFSTAIKDRQAPQFAFQGNQISYVSAGSREDIPFVERMENEIVQPVPPPDDGYEELKGMGSAITEAARFAKPEIDHMALHAVQVVPLKDGTGNVEIVALSTAQAYRRISHQPKITETITIIPNWLFKQPRLVGANIGMRMAGLDFVWFVTAKGMIAGLSMADLPFPTNYRDNFRGLDGRLDFTVDEVAALRRAIAIVGQIKQKERMIGISAGAGRLILRGQETAEVTCQGGPMAEILVDPHLLAEALKVRGVLSLEFKKEDPEHYIRLVGRDIAIALMPCYQNQP